MKKRFDQLLAGYAEGDAISQEARMLRDILRELGFESDIFAPQESIAAAVLNDCRLLDKYDPAAVEGCILHYSTESPVNDAFARSSGRKIAKYHNITPAEFFLFCQKFSAFNSTIFHLLRGG